MKMTANFKKFKKSLQHYLFLVFVLPFLLPAVSIEASALPVPHGIDGFIYELDGITQVRKGIDFYVHNLNNGQIIYGKTGYGSSGGYSVSIKGNDLDTITIKAWNKYNQVNATFALMGVMRNVNLLLNMTFPPIAPNITSQPVTDAIEDQPYNYQIEAFDENSDLLSFSLVESPAGMLINESSGLIKWLPLNKDVGLHNVVVEVSDGLLITNQYFSITVQNVNDKPQIISIPIINATQNLNYFYDVDAIDEDNDTLSYSLIEMPDRMIINQSNGLINWTPNNSQIGLHHVIAEVSDNNLTDIQEFDISVANTNDLPIITSMPVTTAVEDIGYSYDVEAYDIDNDPLSYSLSSYPANMQIDSSNGKITWLPNQNDVGIHNVTVQVFDGSGYAYQPYSLIVENTNDAPVINSTPNTKAQTGKLYYYDVDAYDEENDTLIYSLIFAPKYMAIDAATGLIKWKPRSFQAGNNTVIVQASDGKLSGTQKFTIIVKSSTVQYAKLFAKEKGLAINQTIFAIKELDERPNDLERLSRRVYKYLKIDKPEDNQGDDFEESVVNFSVPLAWIKDNGINYSDIALLEFNDGVWQELPTENISSNDKFVHYSARTTGFSYFAISVKDGTKVKSILNPQISRVKIPYRISGTIYAFGKFRQIPYGTSFKVENINGTEIFDIATGIGQNSGAYSVMLHGNYGDLIKIKIGNIKKEYLTTLKDDDNLDFMINLKNTSFTAISGNYILTILSDSISLSLFVLFISMILFVILIKIKYKKRWN